MPAPEEIIAEIEAQILAKGENSYPAHLVRQPSTHTVIATWAKWRTAELIEGCQKFIQNAQTEGARLETLQNLLGAISAPVSDPVPTTA
jgi:hypothetical protein